ncbi:MAG TPA: TlpA disulfide reductase family protein [Gemmatimonadaceae bacterium]|jgi:cytochrome c biogenesis protein CcmG/thiol:disulfide interchange protein DsbE|nr:TlpA disulfide reductase family protein [Gemmatimonadaceae bacterium]
MIRISSARHARVSAAIVCVAVGAVGCKPNAGREEAFRPIAVGQPVPELTVRTLQGDSVRVAAGEGVTLLHVWATWCGPCQKEFPEIEALQREFGPRGLRIVAVSVDEGEDDPVRAFVQQKGATFEIGRDPDGSVRQLYQSMGVPESYLISADGHLLARQFGAIPEGAAAMRAAIESALGPVVQASRSGKFRRASM